MALDPIRILVFRIGFLGDMLIALPCLHLVRERYPQARITLLSESRQGGYFIAARDIFAGSGLIDDHMFYRFGPQTNRWKEYARLWCEIRRRRFDLLVYLAPSGRPLKAVRRDVLFYRSAGIREIAGARRPEPVPIAVAPRPLRTIPREADLLLSFLEQPDWNAPPAGQGNMDLKLGENERAAVNAWIAAQPAAGGRRQLGLGIGTKMPSKVWPLERYQNVVQRLIERYDVWPVIYGGPEDAARGRELIAALGRGWIAAGALSIREAAQALAQCALYLGNNTGTMHLAACVKTPCVGVFAAREYPGNWDPYGAGNIILREPVECEGCMLEVCVERGMECLMRIGTDAVFEACAALLDRQAKG